jgi:hypothetical protein
VRNKRDKGEPPKSARLVALPRQDRPAIVPVHITVCSQKGQVSLSVQAIQARPGVPGYTVAP